MEDKTYDDDDEEAALVNVEGLVLRLVLLLLLLLLLLLPLAPVFLRVALLLFKPRHLVPSSPLDVDEDIILPDLSALDFSPAVCCCCCCDGGKQQPLFVPAVFPRADTDDDAASISAPSSSSSSLSSPWGDDAVSPEMDPTSKEVAGSPAFVLVL